MKKMNKIANIAIIFMLIVVFLWQDIAYSTDISCLRVPVGSPNTYNRIIKELTRIHKDNNISSDPNRAIMEIALKLKKELKGMDDSSLRDNLMLLDSIKKDSIFNDGIKNLNIQIVLDSFNRPWIYDEQAGIYLYIEKSNDPEEGFNVLKSSAEELKQVAGIPEAWLKELTKNLVNVIDHKTKASCVSRISQTLIDEVAKKLQDKGYKKEKREFLKLVKDVPGFFMYDAVGDVFLQVYAKEYIRFLDLLALAGFKDAGEQIEEFAKYELSAIASAEKLESYPTIGYSAINAFMSYSKPYQDKDLEPLAKRFRIEAPNYFDYEDIRLVTFAYTLYGRFIASRMIKHDPSLFGTEIFQDKDYMKNFIKASERLPLYSLNEYLNLLTKEERSVSSIGHNYKPLSSDEVKSHFVTKAGFKDFTALNTIYFSKMRIAKYSDRYYDIKKYAYEAMMKQFTINEQAIILKNIADSAAELKENGIDPNILIWDVLPIDTISNEQKWEVKQIITVINLVKKIAYELKKHNIEILSVRNKEDPNTTYHFNCFNPNFTLPSYKPEALIKALALSLRIAQQGEDYRGTISQLSWFYQGIKNIDHVNEKYEKEVFKQLFKIVNHGLDLGSIIQVYFSSIKTKKLSDFTNSVDWLLGLNKDGLDKFLSDWRMADEIFKSILPEFKSKNIDLKPMIEGFINKKQTSSLKWLMSLYIHGDSKVKAKDKNALSVIINTYIKSGKPLSEEDWIKIIRVNRIKLLLPLYKLYPELFDYMPERFLVVKRFLAQLEVEISQFPDPEAFEKQIYNNIDGYLEEYLSSKDEESEIIERYKEILSCLNIVHDNLPLCLDAMVNMGKNIKDFEELRKVLPLNSPLTRIIRSLGELEGTAGGYSDVTKTIIKSGKWDKFYSIIIDTAKNKGRQSPQEIMGLLDILKSFGDKIKSWDDNNWNSLKGRIERYYNAGFKVIDYTLFEYFIKHENDQELILSMKEDIQKELGNIAWEEFNGLSKDFKTKYSLTTEDEIALLSKYIPISNLGAKDYKKEYEEIKKAIQDRGNKRRKEVDLSIRTLYSIPSSQNIIIYEGDDADRKALHDELSSYLKDKDIDLKATLQSYFEETNNVTKEDVKKAILVYCVKESGKDINYLSNIPKSDEALKIWLNEWFVLMTDTFKNDLNNKIRNIAKEAMSDLLDESFQKILQNPAYKSLEEIIKDKPNKVQRIIISDKVYNGNIMIIFKDTEIPKIEQELEGFKEIQRDSKDSLYIGFFDDLLHLNEFWMTGVCTWDERHLQVQNTSYHFGELALKDSAGRFLGSSQVQLLKAGIEGQKRKSSPKGWRVIALPGINLYQGNIGISNEKAVLSLLELAQALAEENNMEGAVIPVDSIIHSNNQFEKDFIQKLVKKDWLIKVNLTEIAHLTPTRYSYSEVYLINIPKEEFNLTKTSLDQKISRDRKKEARDDREQTLILNEGLTELVYEKTIPQETVEKVKQKIEELINKMPQHEIGNIRTNSLINNIAIRILIDPSRDQSIINKADTEIELTLGKDILYGDNKIESTTLSDKLSELFTAYILDDYFKLKEDSKTNENSYFKIEVIKALFNYRNYLPMYHKLIYKYNWNESNYLDEKTPEEQKSILAGYYNDLNKYTKGMKNILQWNLFLNIMDDSDTGFMFMNYLHVLFKDNLVTEDELSNLITNISKLDITNKPSLIGLRNLFKDFILTEKVHLNILGNIQTKEEFAYFSNHEQLTQIKDTLLTTTNQNEFYSIFKILLKLSLNLEDKYIDNEIARLLDQDLFSQENRENSIRSALEEILIRRIGGRAYNAILKHLTTQRNTDENIPCIDYNFNELNEGDNADNYGFLQYVKDIDYDLVFGTDQVNEEGVNTKAPYDWVHELFPMPEGGISLNNEDILPHYSGAGDTHIHKLIYEMIPNLIKAQNFNGARNIITPLLTDLKAVNEGKMDINDFNDKYEEKPGDTNLMPEHVSKTIKMLEKLLGRIDKQNKAGQSQLKQNLLSKTLQTNL